LDRTRLRHRQGAVRVVGGIPYPDRATTLSLLPNAVVGRWLAANVDQVSGVLLDLGAGNQPFRSWYEPRVDRVVAVDAAPTNGLDVVSLATPLPFQDETFDTILCTSVLEHVDEAESAVREIVRALKPNGRLLITVPFLYPTHEAPYDFWRVTHLGLKSVLERHGLSVDGVASQGGPFMLVSHYVLGGLGQLVAAASKRLGRFGWLVDNAVTRGLIGLPQELVKSHTSYRLTRLSKAASLGYMAVARKP